MKASPPFLLLRQIEVSAWNNVVHVPLTVVLPRHPTAELSFDMQPEFVPRTPHQPQRGDQQRGQLAEEMGTSIAMIRKHYDAVPADVEPEDYFGIMPQTVSRNIIRVKFGA